MARALLHLLLIVAAIIGTNALADPLRASRHGVPPAAPGAPALSASRKLPAPICYPQILNRIDSLGPRPGSGPVAIQVPARLTGAATSIGLTSALLRLVTFGSPADPAAAANAQATNKVKDTASRPPAEEPAKPPTPEKRMAELAMEIIEEPKNPLASSEDLWRIARESLVHRTSPPRGYTQFFAESELRQSPPEEQATADANMREIADNIDEIKSFWSRSADKGLTFEVRIEQLRRLLVRLHIHGYCESSARIVDFLNQGCANCEGQTRLALSLIQDAGISMPEGYQLGMMRYPGQHQEPVIYRADRHEVYNLVYGTRAHAIDAPIYQPALLLHAYLRGERQPTGGVAAKDLLIAHADPGSFDPKEPVPPSVPTNSKARFDTERSKTLDPRAPPQGYQEISENPLESAGSQGAPDSGSGRSPSSDRIPVNVWDGTPKSGRPKARVEVFESKTSIELVFGDAADARAYSALPKSGARAVFLTALANRTLSGILASAGGQKLQSYLQHPESVADLGVGDLEQISSALNELENERVTMAEAIGIARYDAGGIADNRNPPPPFAALAPINRQLRRYGEWMAADPKAMLQMLDHLPVPQKTRLFALHWTNPTTHYVNFQSVNSLDLSRYMKPLVELATDPKQVAIYSSPMGIQPNEWALEFSSPSHAVIYAPAREDSKVEEATPPMPNPPDTVISPTTMSGLLMAWSGENYDRKTSETEKAIAHRWDRRLLNAARDFYGPKYLGQGFEKKSDLARDRQLNILNHELLLPAVREKLYPNEEIIHADGGMGAYDLPKSVYDAFW